ncbi:MAG TPA: lysophospholipid acyltransferase family protein [Chthoniobacterales bacterium]
MIRRQHDTAGNSDRELIDGLRRLRGESNFLVPAVRAVASLIIRGLLRIYNRFEIVGQERLRTNRPLVIVANHASHLDTLCLLAALPLRKLDRAFPVAAADYFFQSSLRRWFATVVLNALPFGRQLHIRRSLSICSGLIKPGNVLIIFPEGTRSTNGQTQEFKPGVGALVAGRDVVVVPCYLHGTFRAWPKGRYFPRPFKISLIVGEPCNFATSSTGKHANDFIASELRARVQKIAQPVAKDIGS